MTPNGYMYASDTPKRCEECYLSPREGGLGKPYRLFECNGKKVCRRCGKLARVL
jgi:hypothetical protein